MRVGSGRDKKEDRERWSASSKSKRQRERVRGTESACESVCVYFRKERKQKRVIKRKSWFIIQ